jgi:hypothetical protein
MATNPYKYLGPLDPVKDSTILVPRDDDLNRVVQGARRGEYWIIIGPRQMGKTTFLRQLQYRLRDEYVIYLDFQVVPDNEERFYRWLMEEFTGDIPSEPMQDFNEKWRDYASPFKFRKFLEHFRPQSPKRVVILVDEIENMPFIDSFLHTWRSIYSERYHNENLTGYTLILSASSDFSTFSCTVPGTSPFDNIANQLYLKDFSDAESRRFIDVSLAGLNIKIEPTAREELISQISGHPQMLQHACYLLVQTALNRPDTIGEKDVDNAVDIVLKESPVIYTLQKDIKNNPELVRLVKGILKGEKIPYVPYREYSLIGAGCIVEGEESVCAIRNRVYERFLRNILGIPPVRPGIKKEPGWRGIPYGVADYERIHQANLYYVDKTRYLREIEKAGFYLFFIRPRRFGKTLFLSMMETYYDVNQGENFAGFFQGTDIFDEPTPERNSYLVLKFDFSAITPSVHQVEESFFNHVKGAARTFISGYKDQLGIDEKETLKELLAHKNPSDLLGSLLTLCKTKNRKLYLIIDEYDNFANTILSTVGRREYKRLTHGESFFRTFFKVIKSGTSGSGAPISRLFLTGVSPITLDDVTSGFNIGMNISIDAAFNQILGFTEAEVVEMIEYYRGVGMIRHETEYLMEVMSRWYNHYRFSPAADRQVFNSVQVLYFLNEYFKDHRIPDDLIDRSVRIDYDKLKHLILVDKGKTRRTNGNFSRLEEIIDKGMVQSRVTKGFSMERLASPENFTSLLFYFGLLTMAGEGRGEKTKLTIPNETVKKLFYEYISEGYAETGRFRLDLDRLSTLMDEMAYQGRWQPLLEFITGKMEANMGLRDLMGGEKSVQVFLQVYLGLSDLYTIHSEKELNRGFADIVMEPFIAKYDDVKYAYLIEIKYMKRAEGRVTADKAKREAKIQQLKEEAQRQLEQYEMDERFRKSIEKATLIKLIVIFSGHRPVYMGEVKSPASGRSAGTTGR